MECVILSRVEQSVFLAIDFFDVIEPLLTKK